LASQLMANDSLHRVTLLQRTATTPYHSISSPASCSDSGVPHDMPIASATNHGRVAAVATGLLFLAVTMHQHVAGAAPAAAVVPVHHVVGGDPGWDVASDVLAWSADRLFAVGDSLCKSSPPLRLTHSRESLQFPIFQSHSTALSSTQVRCLNRGVLRVRARGDGRRHRRGRRRGGVRGMQGRQPRQSMSNGTLKPL
jgi:hypothetical protein